jgi:agmatinase
MLGGEHTVTLGALRAYKARGEAIGIVHFDAHADLRDTYEGSPYSHACVLRRCHELGFPLAQFGTRAYCKDEADYRKANKTTLFASDAETLALKGPPTPLLPKTFPKKIYVTFDVDGLDPAIMPATGTPVPGGLMWYSALFILKEIAADHDIVGCDIVELAPIPGLHHADFTAAKLTQKLMALMTSA